MKRADRIRLGVLLALICLAATAWGRRPVPKIISMADYGPTTPADPKLAGKGEGLCARFLPIDSRAYFFEDLVPQDVVDPPGLHDTLNRFLDERDPPGLLGSPDFTLGVPFDLSTHEVRQLETSQGDYLRSAGACPWGACPLAADCPWGCPFNGPLPQRIDPFTSFGTRFRGFLNVPGEWVGRVVYIGMYADGAAYTSIYTPTGKVPLLLLTTGLLSSTNHLRLTNQVTFPAPGLYPIEIGHERVRDTASLEVTLYTGDLSPPEAFRLASIYRPEGGTNFYSERDAESDPRPQLSEWPEMKLLEPGLIFQSRTGLHALSNVMQCRQCPRADIDKASSPSCAPPAGDPNGYFCNQAGLCDICRDDKHCGPNCLDCAALGQVCNGKSCVPCVQNSDCESGEVCNDNQCVPCTTDQTCAGNSCNCCPDGTRCAETAQKGKYICARCTADTDCPDGQRCEPNALRCIARSDVTCPQDVAGVERCGADCAPCDGARPLCLDGKVCVACRADTDCLLGNYCNSGDCLPCLTDRRCGPRCGSCTRDQPFCHRPTDRAADARCAACLEDAHCGPGGKCRQDTLTCEAACTACANQPEGRTVCKGTDCVQCISDAQCPCGGRCDKESGFCDPACKNSEDCLGSECCRASTGECVPGRCKPGVGVLCCAVGNCGNKDDVEGGNAEQVPSGQQAGGTAMALSAALLTFALLLRGRRRRRQLP